MFRVFWKAGLCESIKRMVSDSRGVVWSIGIAGLDLTINEVKIDIKLIRWKCSTLSLFIIEYDRGY